ncbi:GNAT family N-acetyltransferase [Deinococcus budaensis]|uniref:RimJ/RimL family protein N-acetyltransferase n=1 Tax=Deinococcus budaensis TaxID=1665626 RepID=A0A7W8GDQ1_9DEIO|nr:RimJ/RimL family protein N-acetyltransferase [Deinococcus budaensis]
MTSPAVTLRPLRPGDEEAAVRWAADPEFCLAAGWTPGLAPRLVRAHWRPIVAGKGPAFLRLGVEVRGRLVGYVDLAELTRTSGEFGIGIGERALWGRGAGLEAGQRMLAHAFGPLGLDTVSAQVNAPNLRSHALMRRLGFREAGRGEPEVYRGELAGVVLYSLTRRGWAGGTGRSEGASPSPFA